MTGLIRHSNYHVVGATSRGRAAATPTRDVQRGLVPHRRGWVTIRPVGITGNHGVSKPPFRAEHIGSLLRPPSLIALRRQFAQGLARRDELAEAEDRAIIEAVRLQDAIGLRAVTDGEFRSRPAS